MTGGHLPDPPNKKISTVVMLHPFAGVLNALFDGCEILYQKN